jgi:hypothetical protein
MRISRTFVAALIGVGMLLVAWFGPWEWPAWPAFAVIQLMFGSHTVFADQPYSVRAAVVVLLIVVNVGVWAGVALGLMALGRRFASSRAKSF